MTIEEEYFDDANYGDTGALAEHDETEDLASTLPAYLPSAYGTGHYKLFYPVGAEIAQAKHDIRDTAYAIQVEEATTMGQLERLGALFETPPNEGEGLEHYRARLLAEGIVAVSEGTIADIINGAVQILGIRGSQVTYEEPIASTTENGTASVEVPGEALDESPLTSSEVADFLDRIAPAGCRISSISRGTFTYISTTDYGSDNHDATKGYDGLDGSGNPKDNGGTYAGVI